MEHGQDIFTHVISRDLARLLSWKMSFVVFQSEPQNMLWSQNISCFLNTTIWPNDVTTVITSLLLKYGNSMMQIISSLTWSIEPEIIRLAPLYKMVNWSNFSLLLRIIIKKFPFLLCQSIIGFKFSPEKWRTALHLFKNMSLPLQLGKYNGKKARQHFFFLFFLTFFYF